jgi:hypothetical protein
MSSVNVFQECLSVDVSPEGLGLIVEFLLLPARGYIPCQLTPQLPAVCSVRSDRKSAAAAATLAVAVEVFVFVFGRQTVEVVRGQGLLKAASSSEMAVNMVVLVE